MGMHEVSNWVDMDSTRREMGDAGGVARLQLTESVFGSCVTSIDRVTSCFDWTHLPYQQRSAGGVDAPK